jgi:hypothetical protein
MAHGCTNSVRRAWITLAAVAAEQGQAVRFEWGAECADQGGALPMYSNRARCSPASRMQASERSTGY